MSLPQQIRLGRTTLVKTLPLPRADIIVVTAGSPGGSDAQYDEKNIRRRVYDALNVLMAMDIIEKERKEKLITWRGLPSGPNTSLERLRAQKLQLTFQLERQQKYIEVCSAISI